MQIVLHDAIATFLQPFLTENNNQGWIDFDPILSPKPNAKLGDWRPIRVLFQHADNDYIYTNRYKTQPVADFQFHYGDVVGFYEYTGYSQKCGGDDRQFNRGFYEQGIYEKAWGFQDDDWKKQFQVKLVFYCE